LRSRASRFDDCERCGIEVGLTLSGGIVVFPDSCDPDYRTAVAIAARRVKSFTELEWHPYTNSGVAACWLTPVDNRGMHVVVTVELGPHPTVLAEPVIADQLTLDCDFGSG
jgi:hypothetical protein